MTAPRHRISRGSDFSRTLRTGVRVSARDFVLHASPVPPVWPDDSRIRRDVALHGGPWLGLIVSKAVGPAVTRHEVARRLRAAFTATIYGIASANLLFLPIAAKLKSVISHNTRDREMVIEGLISIAQGENPRNIESKLAGYLH